MPHNDDAFATMLLMSQLSADREELVRPLTPVEFYRLRAQVQASAVGRLGGLIGMDVSALKSALEMQEADAYRLCVLLNRIMPLSYALERFIDAGIDIVTADEIGYPESMIRCLADKAPPMLYACGSLGLAARPSVAVLGVGGAKRGVEACAARVIGQAARAHLVLVGGGEFGFGRMVEAEAERTGASFISFLAESLSERIYQPGLSEMIVRERALVLSAVHPDAKYTVSHALERNKCLYALGGVAIVVGCEQEKGVTWEGACAALRNRWVDELYVWDESELKGNRALIARGAKPFREAKDIPYKKIADGWGTPAYEQLSFI